MFWYETEDDDDDDAKLLTLLSLKLKHFLRLYSGDKADSWCSTPIPNHPFIHCPMPDMLQTAPFMSLCLRPAHIHTLTLCETQQYALINILLSPVFTFTCKKNLPHQHQPPFIYSSLPL